MKSFWLKIFLYSIQNSAFCIHSHILMNGKFSRDTLNTKRFIRMHIKRVSSYTLIKNIESGFAYAVAWWAFLSLLILVYCKIRIVMILLNEYCFILKLDMLWRYPRTNFHEPILIKCRNIIILFSDWFFFVSQARKNECLQ